MYEQPERHSYTFQSYVQLTMTQLHMARTNKPIKIMERSLWSARYVFAENLLASKKMAISEFEVLNAWFEFLKNCPTQIDLNVDLIIYLRTTPQVAYERLKARARSEEKIVSLDYLTTLHNLHENWLQNAQLRGGAKLLVIDADKDIKTVPGVYSEHEASILEAVNKHQHNCISLTSNKGRPFSNLSNSI